MERKRGLWIWWMVYGEGSQCKRLTDTTLATTKCRKINFSSAQTNEYKCQRVRDARKTVWGRRKSQFTFIDLVRLTSYALLPSINRHFIHISFRLLPNKAILVSCATYYNAYNKAISMTAHTHTNTRTKCFNSASESAFNLMIIVCSLLSQIMHAIKHRVHISVWRIFPVTKPI